MKFRTIESIYEMKKSTIQIHVICKCELKYDLLSLIKKRKENDNQVYVVLAQQKKRITMASSHQ